MKKVLTLILVFTTTLVSLSAPISKKPATNGKAKPMKVQARVQGAILGEGDPIYDPEGEDETYIMDATEFSWTGEQRETGEKMVIRRSADGKTIYFRDLAPLCNFDSATGKYGWIEGSIEGNDITVKAGQLLIKTDYGHIVYLETVTVDDGGEFESFQPEVHFTIDGNKIYQTNNDIYVSAYIDGETIDDAGFYVFINSISMEPMGDIPSFTPPAGVEIEDWVMTNPEGQSPVKVARDGNTVYIAGMSSMAPEDYVCGTINDGKLTFKSYYILSSNNRYFLRLAGAREGEPDEWDIPTFELTENYSFDISEDGLTYTLNPAEDYIVSCSYDLRSIYEGVQNVKIFKYAGDVPATPTTPEITFWSPEDLCLQFQLPCEDTEGNYINPDKLVYRIFLNGSLHTFSPDDYVGLMEEMTEIPYNFTDNYDIYTRGALKTIFLHTEDVPQSIKVEAIYTVDGESHSSAFAEWASVNDVTTSHAINKETYTDLLGRRIATPTPGSLVIKTTHYTDGSTVVTKEIIK